MPNPIKVPSATEVAEAREREAGRKRNLFKSRAEQPEKRPRVRPDSRRLDDGASAAGTAPAISLSSLEISERAMGGSEPVAPAAVTEPQLRVHLTTIQAQAKSGLVVNRNQVGNPVLKHIRDVTYQFSDNAVPDFLLGQHSCALFLSLRYHLLYPEYVYGRIRRVGNLYKTRVLLCLIDIQDHEKALRELTKLSVIYGWTLICVNSNREAARYLETYRIYENKSPDSIMQRVEEDYVSKLHGALSSVRSVNKTDAKSLALNFGSLKGVITASKEQLAKCPGIGGQKVTRLYSVFNNPLRKSKAAQGDPTDQSAPS